MSDTNLDNERILRIEDTVDHLKKSLESAFTKDEDGNIDYAGHRNYHRKEVNSEKRSIESLAEFKKNIVTWAVIGLITLVVSAMWRNYLEPLLALAGK